MIFQTKREIGEMLSETPVYGGQDLPNGKYITYIGGKTVKVPYAYFWEF